MPTWLIHCINFDINVSIKSKVIKVTTEIFSRFQCSYIYKFYLLFSISFTTLSSNKMLFFYTYNNLKLHTFHFIANALIHENKIHFKRKFSCLISLKPNVIAFKWTLRHSYWKKKFIQILQQNFFFQRVTIDCVYMWIHAHTAQGADGTKYFN